MSNFKTFVLIVILICACLIPIVHAENAVETSVQKQTNILDLLQKARTKQTEPTESSTEIRILHFPRERSLGQLMIGEENHDYKSTTFGYPFEEISWERYGHAQGDVKIPTDKKVRLILYSWTWQNPQNLSALKRLRPDDIYSLTLSPEWSLGGKSPNDDCMPFVAYLTGLKTLNLDGADITTKGLEYLTLIKSLEQLRLPAGLTDAGMEQIGKLTSLKVLYFCQNNNVTNTGLAQLSKLHSLKQLFLISVRTTDRGLKYLSGHPSLSHLILAGNFSNDVGLYLKDVPYLRTLKIDMAHFNDRGMKNISNLTHLENLDTHWVESTTDRGIKYLKNLQNLKQLDVAHAKLTDKAMLDLRQISKLECLYLPYSDLTDEGFKHIDQLDNLRYLCAGSSSLSPLTDNSLYSIGMLSNLEELHIGGEDFSDEGMIHIAKLTNLKRLSLFSAGQVTNKSMIELASLKSLKYLNLGCRVSISALNSFNNLKNLNYLTLRNIYQDKSVLDISGLINLERLRLSLSYERKGKSVIYESFQNEDLKCLSKLHRLQTLMLAGAGINNEGMSNISGLTNLIHLNIICPGETQINDDSLKYLTNMQRLYEINIRDGHFTDKALNYLVGLPSLSRLELTSDFAFSNKAIRDFQLKNPNITTLRLTP